MVRLIVVVYETNEMDCVVVIFFQLYFFISLTSTLVMFVLMHLPDQFIKTRAAVLTECIALLACFADNCVRHQEFLRM